MALAQALLKRIMQFFAGQTLFAIFKIVAHHGFVDLDDLVNNFLMPVIHRANVGSLLTLAFGFKKTIDNGFAILRR